MMEDFGWEYLGDYHQFSYFRIPSQGQNPELFTDFETKKNHVHRIFWGRAFSGLAFLTYFWFVSDSDNQTHFLISLGFLTILIFLILIKDYLRLLKKFKDEGDTHNGS